MSLLKAAIANSKGSAQVSNVTDATDVTDKAQLSAEIAKVKRIGIWVLGLGLGGFIAFAALVPLDEGVPTQGLVSIDTKRKVIQHLQGGIVNDVLVSEGQTVAQNQTLIKLADGMVRAQYETIRQQFFNLKIIEARLLAEQAGSSVITFDPDLTQLALQDKQLNHQFKL